jgi:hypothetical protein
MVKLLSSKYLKGRQLWQVPKAKGSSWVWNTILATTEVLGKRINYCHPNTSREDNCGKSPRQKGVLGNGIPS